MTKRDEEATTHRFFSPSASGRWFGGGCTASLVVDTSDVAEKRRRDAERGTRLHSIGEKILREGVDERYEDLPDADRDSIDAYVDYVRGLGGTKLYEYAADFVPGLCGGTADAVAIEPDPGVLEIVDYKSGTGRVEAVGNTQEAIYWLGVHRRLHPLGDFRTARLTIVQPALGPPTTWEATRGEILELGEEIRDVVNRVMDGDVEFVASEDNCRFCPAKAICPEHVEMANRAAADDFRDHPDPELAKAAEKGVENMTWGERLRLVPLLRQWCKAVESATSAMLLRGERVDGFKVVEGRKANRSWGDRRSAKRIMESWGLDETEIFTEPVMISPAQAEKKAKESAGDDPDLAKTRRSELSECWVEGKPGPPTVVPESDKRSPIDKDELAKRDFSHLIDGEDD